MREKGETKGVSPSTKRAINVILGILILGGLWEISLYNYVLFHSLIEVFTVVVVASIFVLIWNARYFLDDHYFLFLAIASLFIGVIDLIHILAYKGMGVFTPYDPNYQTQLWVTARYLQGISFLIAPLFFYRKTRPLPVFLIYGAAVLFAILSIFFWHIFPATYVEGKGLTFFKKASEYVVIFLLLCSMAVLSLHRARIDRHAFRMILASIALTIISEFCFTLYAGYFDIFNVIGHFLRLLSFYCLYRAIIIAGLVRPYDLFFIRRIKDEEELLRAKEGLEKTAARRALMLEETSEWLQRELKERSKAEEALKLGEDKIRGLYTTLIDGFVRVNLNGRIIECNETYRNMLGYGPVEIKGLTYEDITPSRWRRPEKEIIETQVMTRGYSETYEKEYRRKDGTVFPVELRVILLRDNKGGPLELCAVVRDITERRRIEDALLESEEQYRALFDSVNDAIFIYNSGGKILKVNRTAVERYGYSKEEFAGMFVSDVIVDDERGNVPERMDRIRRFGQAVIETTHIRKDKTVFPVEVNVRLIDYRGDPAFLAIVRDITERRQADEAYRKISERFQSFFSAVTAGVAIHRFVHDEKGNKINYEMVDVNPGYEEMLGVKRENVIGKPVTEAFNVSEPPCLAEFSSAAGSRGPYRFEVLYPPLNKHLHISFCSMGKDYFAVIFFDITQQKEMQEALKRSEAMLRSVVNTAPIGIALATPDRIIKWVNSAMADMAGYTVEGLQDKSARMLYPSDEEFACVQEVVYGAIKRGAMGTMDTKWINSNGRLLDVHVCAAPIDAADISAGVVFTATDITERKRIEEEVRTINVTLEEKIVERTEELSDLYNNAPCGYHSLDGEGRFVRINDTELKMFGYDREEIMGRRFSDFLTKKGKETFEKNFPLFKERGWMNNLEFEIIRKDGSILPILLNATAIYDESRGFVHSRSNVFDNSEQKRIQAEIEDLNKELDEKAHRLEAVNKELESFNYTVSHDLKAPLRGIDGYSRLLLEDYAEKLDETGKGFLAAIKKASSRMAQLIDGLLEYSRFERESRLVKAFSVRGYVKEMLDAYEEEIRNRSVVVELSLADATLHLVPEGFAVVFRNLLENALKFTRGGENPVIKIEGIVADNSYVMSISDNGCGFDMQHQGKIFEIFHRLPGAEDYPGTGLGLALVRKAVQRAGGRIWAKSEPGKGAEFFVEFPIETEDR